MSIFLSTAYLGSIQYYSKFFFNEPVYIEACESYLKQSYRNRCHILSSNGLIGLSIPVESRKGIKTSVKDVRISYHGNWQHLHWQTLVSAYNSTPYFEFYRDYFEPFYQRVFTYLFDFNEELRLLIFELLDIQQREVLYTTEFIKEVGVNDIDLRYLISPKIEFNDFNFIPLTYYQVFESKFGFVQNLSIVDLLFNMGNESMLYLMNSYKKSL